MPSLFAIVKEWRSLRSCLCWCSELVCFAFYQPPSHLYIRSCIPYSVSCICPETIPALKCTSMHFLSQHQRFLPKARWCQRGLSLTSHIHSCEEHLCRHLVLLQTSLHSIQNVRDGMLTDQEPGTRSCAIPVHQLSLFSCARGLTPTTQTLAGKSAADGSVWYPEMTRSPITVRLCCRVRSSEKPQGWDERQIGAQGQH